jgi:septum formation protein
MRESDVWAADLLGCSGRQVVLASASPRRRDLLTMLGLSFEIRIPEVDEVFPRGATPAEGAQSIALRKARAAQRAGGEALVLAADTMVVIDGTVLGKPSDAASSRRMLSTLAGATHTVVTGIAVLDELSGVENTGAQETEVTFASLDDSEIRTLVETRDGLDKAGSYGIQSIGAMAVESIRGDYFNVVGLPLQLTKKLFLIARQGTS